MSNEITDMTELSSCVRTYEKPRTNWELIVKKYLNFCSPILVVIGLIFSFIPQVGIITLSITAILLIISLLLLLWYIVVCNQKYTLLLFLVLVFGTQALGRCIAQAVLYNF